MVAELGAELMGWVPPRDGHVLDGSLVSARESRSLRVLLGERMKQQWEESAKAFSELGMDGLQTVA